MSPEAPSLPDDDCDSTILGGITLVVVDFFFGAAGIVVD